MQYADYAAWQRELAAGRGAGAAARRTGREQLAGAPALLELPTDRPRPPVQTLPRARRCRVRAARGRCRARCEALARREGATLFMMLLAAFQVLLSRYAGQDDVVVGTPIAGPHAARRSRG